jgi:putative ABC transport system permease protein
MKGYLFIAWGYLVRHRIKTAILVLSIGLIVFVPVGLQVLVSQSARELTVRAESTPLVIGAKGSPLELVLNSLYFESDSPPQMRYKEAARVSESGLAGAIPLYVRFRSREHPIVGTTLDYFGFRGLRIATGKQMGLLGDCVLGAEAAHWLGVSAGGHVVSSPENVFDLAGIYPLKMRVTGVLAPSNSPDDNVIFVDIKTAWIIEGLAHGHRDLARPEAAGGVLSRDGKKIVANASVRQYTEITDANRQSFHFHGDTSEFPITGVIAVPRDAKSGALLQGRYQGEAEMSQIIVPATVMDELLGTILTIRSFVVAAMGTVALATLATTALVFFLSVRLRRREIETMVRIGGARGGIAAILACEVVLVLLMGFALAAGLTVLASEFGASIVRSLIV